MSDRNYWTQSRDHIAIIGHRGARALYPENTMVSFEKAVEMGVDGIETDVHMTTDGQLVLHHDDLLDRTTTGSGPIEAYSYKELMEFDAGVKFSPKYAGEKIPRLEEFLDLVQNTDLLLNVEMKDYRPEALRKTIETLDRYGLRDRYVIASFSATVTTMAHKLYGVKTQGFPLYMVKYRNAGCHEGTDRFLSCTRHRALVLVRRHGRSCAAGNRRRRDDDHRERSASGPQSTAREDG